MKKSEVKKQLLTAQNIKHVAESLHTSVLFHQQPVRMLIAGDQKGLHYVDRLKNYSDFKLDQLRGIKHKEAWTELARQCMNYLYYTSWLMNKIEEERQGLQDGGIFGKPTTKKGRKGLTGRLAKLIGQESLKFDLFKTNKDKEK